jgi:hypothetical protein
MTAPTTSPARECEHFKPGVLVLDDHGHIDVVDKCRRHQMILSGPTCLACPDYEPREET